MWALGPREMLRGEGCVFSPWILSAAPREPCGQGAWCICLQLYLFTVRVGSGGGVFLIDFPTLPA